LAQFSSVSLYSPAWRPLLLSVLVTWTPGPATGVGPLVTSVAVSTAPPELPWTGLPLEHPVETSRASPVAAREVVPRTVRKAYLMVIIARVGVAKPSRRCRAAGL